MFKQSNNVKDLNSSIWNSWADSEGNINKAYGYQIRKETMGYPSQLHYVIDQIKNNPKSRRIMMNMFSVDEQHEKEDRKSTRLNSSHVSISYAVFCLK